MISRHWKGIVRRDLADRYVSHLEDDTFPQLASLAGFVRATILRRDVESGTEFQVVTLWDSLAAIKAFAGADVEAAVVPDKARDMMVDYDRRAAHYEVVASFDSGRTAGPDVR
jgi:heme-degrading monooxygenase HmoA